MRAAIFRKPGQRLELGSIDDPTPGPGELVLKVEACGICGSDLHISDNHDGSGGMPPLKPDSVMGHEFCGEIVAIGSGVDNGLKEGMRVASLPTIGCGRCAPCLTGDVKRCRDARGIGLGDVPGGYAQYVRVGAAESLRLPEHFGKGDGALIEPLAVGLRAAVRARLQPGEHALIAGAGPVGLATAIWCRHFGARHVVVSDLNANRAETAARFGATEAIDASKENVIERYKQVAGARPDIVFDCVGVPGSMQLAIDYAGFDSRVVIVGVCMHEDRIMPVKPVTKELDLIFAYCYLRQEFGLCIDMLDQGRIEASGLITDRVGFDGFADAFEALKTPNTQVKVLLEPDRA
ncbi:MAG: alcohol dehydrogenase catalytic domain-containing protein [Minwuia sp.]|uniref:alcohol dehydrogenase catalytic domain-containing protein n=1 Tax=Minwuia sp. TaxID=2493630 RepID=UPI003A8B69DE